MCSNRENLRIRYILNQEKLHYRTLIQVDSRNVFGQRLIKKHTRAAVKFHLAVVIWTIVYHQWR